MPDRKEMNDWPPPPDGSGRPRRGAGSRRWLIAATVAIVLVGGVLYRGGFGSGQALAPVAEPTAPQPVAVLVVGAADIDLPATDLAKQRIAQESLAEAARPAAESTRAPAPDGSAPAPSAATRAPTGPKPAPVVHRPQPAVSAPKLSAPPPAPVAETEQAVRQLLALAPAATREAIAAGRQVIYSLHVPDEIVGAGNGVEIFVNGTSYGQVLLASAGQDILIPLAVGSTAKVRVVATQDGGGGVTFGVASSQGEIRSTVMAVGERDDWSVTAQ